MNDLMSGFESELLKTNPIFTECVNDLRRNYYTKWCESNFSDVTNREEIFKLMCNLELVVKQLDKKIFEAEVAKHNSEIE